jgi:hypothetical protein
MTVVDPGAGTIVIPAEMIADHGEMTGGTIPVAHAAMTEGRVEMIVIRGVTTGVAIHAVHAVHVVTIEGSDELIEARGVMTVVNNVAVEVQHLNAAVRT